MGPVSKKPLTNVIPIRRKKIGTSSPVAVNNVAVASLAAEDELGRWLADHWGDLADTPPEILTQIEF